MIKLEHVVLASPEQMEFVIEGMRNAKNSWDRSDSYIDRPNTNCNGQSGDPFHVLGDNDHSLMQQLSKAGTDHRKYMRMMPVYARITAPLYLWKEFDTYKVGTVSNSCSTMHKIGDKEFTLEDFSCEHLSDVTMEGFKKQIEYLECLRLAYMLGKDDAEYAGMNKKDLWRQMIQLLPSSYNQTRNIMMNYEVLANIYKSRKNHKLDEWREFCKWIEELPYSELIVGENNSPMTPNEFREFCKRTEEKNCDIPEETIDKLNAIGNVNAMDSKNIQEAIDECEKEKED